jgi:hypothetical protein
MSDGDDAGKNTDALELTPGDGFDIKKSAAKLAKIAKEMQTPLIIRLPHRDVEFPPGSTKQQIIDGYVAALKEMEPSNTN